MAELRGLTRRWILDDDGGAMDTPLPLVERILRARGLVDPDEITRFCEPRLLDLHDPALLPGCDDAAHRLAAALRDGRRIVIYGDYDVDGITATAILYHTFKAAMPGASIRTYVPHRLEEGYGINVEALRQLRSEGADLVISVDCGVTAVEPARVAKEIGLELIITDHHAVAVSRQQSAVSSQPEDGDQRPEAERLAGGAPAAVSANCQPPTANRPLPDALLVHPALPGSEYPFSHLCGAGVAFKLAWRFANVWCGTTDSGRVSDAFRAHLMEMLPLVALGTIADVVPLIGENRILASNGLRLIKQTKLAGLRALLEASNLMGENIDCQKVGFVLGPRLNACGRMGHAAEAVHLLTDASPDEARTIAARLTQFNRQRQQIERAIFQRACELAEDRGMTADDRRIIVLADPSWHPGVVGIVCSRLVDRFGRPAILMNQSKTECRGSARSIEGYSIHEALGSCAPLLQSFGGHDMAAGLSVAADRLDDFTEALTEHANAHIEVDQLIAGLAIDCEAELSELDHDTVQRIGRLSPFGRANRRPAIRLSNVVVNDPPRQIGQHGRHLSFRVRQESGGGRRVMRVVWWSQGERAADLAPGMPLDIAVEPKLNHWNGRTSVEAEIKDVRVLEPAAVGAAP